jgi:hypothetical protein
MQSALRANKSVFRTVLTRTKVASLRSPRSMHASYLHPPNGEPYPIVQYHPLKNNGGQPSLTCQNGLQGKQRSSARGQHRLEHFVCRGVTKYMWGLVCSQRYNKEKGKTIYTQPGSKNSPRRRSAFGGFNRGGGGSAIRHTNSPAP